MRGANKKAQMSLLNDSGLQVREDEHRRDFVRVLRRSFKEKSLDAPVVRILGLSLATTPKGDERVTIVAEVDGVVVDGVSEANGEAVAGTVFKKLQGDNR